MHRDAKPADFEGKTIAVATVEAINFWQFVFTDGTSVGVEVVNFGIAGPGMTICECEQA